MAVDEFTQAQVLGEGHREEQPGIGHQPGVVEGDTDAVGMTTAYCFGYSKGEDWPNEIESNRPRTPSQQQDITVPTTATPRTPSSLFVTPEPTFTPGQVGKAALVAVGGYMELELAKVEPAYEWECSYRHLGSAIVTLAGITFDDVAGVTHCEGTGGPEGVVAMLRVEIDDGWPTVINRIRGEGLGVECVTRVGQEPVCSPVAFDDERDLIDWHDQLWEQFLAL